MEKTSSFPQNPNTHLLHNSPSLPPSSRGAKTLHNASLPSSPPPTNLQYAIPSATTCAILAWTYSAAPSAHTSTTTAATVVPFMSLPAPVPVLDRTLLTNSPPAPNPPKSPTTFHHHPVDHLPISNSSLRNTSGLPAASFSIPIGPPNPPTTLPGQNVRRTWFVRIANSTIPKPLAYAPEPPRKVVRAWYCGSQLAPGGTYRDAESERARGRKRVARRDSWARRLNAAGGMSANGLGGSFSFLFDAAATSDASLELAG
ncbi:hypothetical protein CkaCkLH20_06360 [Colletotrichum karsti]|uniref:Uncharacterized protein n=1 Tax=Colletotrichum karsti TaxID=1095194 RepID=A0A9P6I3T4_9PEZI|nr:uncharacterized protein CkaCkLH20_06360 [Colletotrichum karsti]KAF9876417.1 hypothetical protein CkaCkLH20_06360 [Colletotrichum karsti]